MTGPPNIILLVMDSVRAAHLSCYGYGRPTTPNIDRLAREGTLFEQAISVGCWTLPVHASLFTGLYPISHGLTVSKDALPEDYPTLAYRLTQQGYQTACFSNNAYVSAATGLVSGFDTVRDVWHISHPRGLRRTKASKLIERLRRYGRWGRPAIGAIGALRRVRSALKKRRRACGDSGAALTHREIESWLAESRRSRTPFFLFVNYMECHEPYRPPSPYDLRFVPPRFSTRRIARAGNYRDNNRSVSEKRRRGDREIVRAQYDGALCYLDTKIGELMRLLAAQGILDDTVVIVTSDHGDSLGEHGQFGHRTTLYEPLVRVPLVIRYPARFRPATSEAGQVPLIDLYPTVLELAGAEVPETTDSGCRSLLANGEIQPRPFTIAENTAPKSHDGVVARMVRTDRYKYIWKSNGKHELYDLRRDPGETVNVITDDVQVADRMQRQLVAWQDSLQSCRIDTSEAHYDDVVVDRLRELGYVD